MAGNPLFPAPSPSMVEFSEAISALKQANLDAIDRGKRAILLKNIAEQVITDMISRLAAYVNSVCQGDEAKIASSGFELTKRPSPISHIGAPLKAKARRSALERKLDLSWSSVLGAVAYVVEEVTGGDSEGPTWTMVKLTTDHRAVLDGRDKGVSCTFRVRAIGRRVESACTIFTYLKAA
ncbi:MAG: hypothetical protein ACOH13_01905 [Flavobacteriales bacterium]